MSRPLPASDLRSMARDEQASDDVAKSLQQMKGMLNGDGGAFHRLCKPVPQTHTALFPLPQNLPQS